MGKPDLSQIRPDYLSAIVAVRSQLSDNLIQDILERYRSGDLDRDSAMDGLNIDYIGVLYELIAVYRPTGPQPDAVEEDRQRQMMELLLRGDEVPLDLRQPARTNRQ